MKFSNVIKKENGITGIDISISILIITIFTGIIATLFYNIYITSTSIQRSDTATNIAVNIIEYANKINYDQVDSGLINLYKTNEKDISKGYTVEANVSNYTTTANGKEDIIKIIEVQVKYNVGKIEETFSVKTLKVKEQ